MKRIVNLISAVVFFVSASAQDSTIPITTGKTTTLVFPFPIVHVDRGSKNILAQEVNDPKNILLIKAAVKDFDTTNLTVIASDGSAYSFTIEYSDTPSAFLYKLPAQSSASIATYANDLLDNPAIMHHSSANHWGISIRITGIYIKDNTIFYQLALGNTSPVNYDIDFIKFYIKDKKVVRRTAAQEIELKPLYMAGNTRLIKANDTNTIVVPLEKLIIPDAKDLIIEVMERNGGRNLQLKVHNRQIMKAITLPDMH